MHRQAIKDKISAFGNLGKNWDSYGANPPSETTIQKALWFVDKLTDEELYSIQPVPTDEAIEFEGKDFLIRIWSE